MLFVTLTYSGVEKALADWGVQAAGGNITLANLASDILRLAVPTANYMDDPIFPFEAPIVLQTGRISSTGAANSFSGGVGAFAGVRGRFLVDGRPSFEGVYYDFEGPWYHIKNTPYQQLSAWWLGPADQTAPDLSSDVLLMFKIVTIDGLPTYSRVTTQQQIFDTLQHVLDQCAAQSIAAPFQVTLGNIGVAAPLATYPMQDVHCSEVIEYCLQASPDATFWFDYTTSPPTAYVTQRSNATPISLALADATHHETLRITPRYDLQPRSVVLFFKQTNRIDNNSWMLKTKQKYGPHGLNSDLDPDGGLRVHIETIDLVGFSQSNVYGELTTVAVTNDLAFWSIVVPELRSTQVRSFVVLDSMTIVDDSGSAVSLSTYPNALMDGSSICPWMTLVGGTPVVGIRATITADVSYVLWDVEATGGDRSQTNGTKLETFPKKRLHWRGVLTNGVTSNYSAVASAIAGEAIPTGLAQWLWNALATLQYEGEVSTIQADISGGIGMGNTLNLSNGRSEWASMNAQIQSITKDLDQGKLSLRIGPTRLLSARGLMGMTAINRMRRIYNNPEARVTGQSPASSNTVTMGPNQAKENTNTGLDQKAFLRLLFTQSA
jgi:hypothetical protein